MHSCVWLAYKSMVCIDKKLHDIDNNETNTSVNVLRNYFHFFFKNKTCRANAILSAIF